MAEYYPLLAKAVGSLPNSTPDSRRVVYERARKALIGQLRTLHPPIPDDDIESESVALDKAIERLESELANGSLAPAPAKPQAGTKTAEQPADSRKQAPAIPPVVKPAATKPPAPAPSLPPAAQATPTADSGGALGPAQRRPIPPLRTKPPKPPAPKVPEAEATAAPAMPALPVPAVPPSPPTGASPMEVAAETMPPAVGDAEAPTIVANQGKRLKPPRTDLQRPIAPQPPVAQAPKRRLWILPVAVVVVVAAVGFAAWKLRDHPETIVQGKPAAPTQADSGKIAERIGQPPTSSPGPGPGTQPQAPAVQPSDTQGAGTNSQPQPQQAAPAPANPELPVAHRAALLVEAPDEPNKVKTFLGTVVWKLNNAPQGPNDAVGVAVEADIDLPDDKMKAVVTFAKNTEASLPASHTINIRYTVDSGSFTGDVKQISVPQMRPEASPSGEPLAGVTVQIVPNSFLVGLSPGNDEAANTDLMRRLQWIDIPMLLDNGKIAKLTFEKGESGQRDIADALDAWAKQ